MIKPDIKIELKTDYMGSVNIRAKIHGKHYILNQKNIEQTIENKIKERGFTTNRTGRQRYDRLLINN